MDTDIASEEEVNMFLFISLVNSLNQYSVLFIVAHVPHHVKILVSDPTLNKECLLKQ